MINTPKVCTSAVSKSFKLRVGFVTCRLKAFPFLSSRTNGVSSQEISCVTGPELFLVKERS